ncbi:MAG: RecX family transcriptional regulator [Actinomycetota bacterium]
MAAIDHDERLDDALKRAFRFIAKRERTASQVSERLQRDGIETPIINEVVEQMLADGYIDDERFAQLFAEDRRRLDGWGSERIVARLREAGVSEEIIESQVGSRGHQQEVDDAVRVLEERLPAKPSDPKERERALGILARRGYSLDVAYQAVRDFERR